MSEQSVILKRDNVSYQVFSDDFSEALFKQAVIDDFGCEIMKTQEDKTPIAFSARYERRMSALFAKERRRARFHRLLASARHVAVAFNTKIISQ
jgi:membrane-anchored protein YejM (alkaline phosphatase superfamily)